jgi:lipopolysaccharide export system permease protein
VDGRNVFYIKEISRDRQKMKDVFMAQKSNKKKQQNAIAGDERWMVLSANTAHQMTDKTTKDQFMVTTNGNRYEGMPGRMDYQTIKFDTYGQRIGTSNAAGDTEGMEIVSTKKLFKLAWSNAEAMGVLQWRISMPISVIILTLLAVPLSKVNPRQGRFAQLFPAVMIYIVYANMMFVGENWIKNGTIPGWLGVWWIHVIMFVVAIGLLFRRRSL